MTMHFGATLRLMRLESGLSLRDLARRLGVSSAYLSRVENGLDAAPTPARLDVMARELGVPAPVLMDLAHRVSPLVVDYVDQVPEAGTLFLEIAHRRLDARELDVLRAFVNERFPVAGAAPSASAPRFSDLLSKDRVVLRLACLDMDDVFDVAAGRLDAFWEMGLSRWDMAAGALLIQEAGGLVCELDGEAGFLDSGEIAAATPKVLPQLLACLRG